jgi:type VI protein secretion system component Hcp
MKNLRGTVVLALALFAIPSFAAVDAFIWFDKVKGESTDAAHKGWVEISSFSWGVTNPTASAAAVHSNNAQGCATNEIHFATRDAAITQLQKMAMMGTHLQPVTLEVNGQRHVLEGAMIASCQNNLSSGGDRPSLGTCVMKFQRCSTHANTTVNASLVNRNTTLTQPNGQILFDTDAADVSVLAVRPGGANDVVVVARGTSSPVFFKNCVAGAHYKKVTLQMRKAGGTQQEYLKFVLHDVIVTGVTRSADG